MNNELMTQEISDNSITGKLLARSTSFSSLKADTQEDKIALFNAINTPDERLKSHVNKTLYIKDIYCETVSLQRELPDGTVEISDCPRIVLLDKDGVSYACVSAGVFSSLQKIISLFGVPTWSTPIAITPVTIDKGDRSILTLTIAEQGKKKSK